MKDKICFHSLHAELANFIINSGEDINKIDDSRRKDYC